MAITQLPDLVDNDDEVDGKPGRKSMIADPPQPGGGHATGPRMGRRRVHHDRVLRDGFEFEGRKYKSLSAPGWSKYSTGTVSPSCPSRSRSTPRRRWGG